MGTNFYLHEKPDCECCGRPFEPLHIGKSSGGWYFSLHVMPEDGINNLDDWREMWNKKGALIRDEYGEKIYVEEMEKRITERSWKGGLTRHPIDGRHCIGHGEGTYDFIIGEFS